MCDGAGQSAWSFDQVGNPQIEKRVTNGVPNAITYGYNLDASGATVQYPSGRTITYQPGGAQRPLSAKDVADGISYAVGPTAPNYIVSYASQGAIQSLQDGSSLVSTLYYNNRLQPCRISVKSSGTVPTSCTDATNIGNVLDFTYGFNAGATDNGNVIRIANNIAGSTGRSSNYAYDWLNRITSAYTDATSGNGCWGETYSIDRYGNLTTITGKSGYSCTQESGLSITLNSANQITGPGTFTYDAAGNMTGEPSPSCLTSVAYDAEGRVASACGVMYYYDGDGRRVRKSSGILYWYGAGSDPLLETDAGGNLLNEYVFLNGKRIARRDSSGNVEYYVSDHLESSRVVTNSSRTALESCDYYPYGGSNCAPSSVNNYLFTGKERDGESALDDFGARYYSSQYGRFISPDEFWKDSHVDDPQSWNKYAYARNNPLRYVDPTGQNAWIIGRCKGGGQNGEGHESCNIQINATIAIYAAAGSNLSQAQLNAAATTMQNSIDSAWTGSFQQNGVTYNVTTQVTVSVASSQDAAMQSGAQNVIGMTNGQVTTASGHQAGAYVNPKTFWGALTGKPDTGLMDIRHVDDYASHEFTHLLGTNDKEGAVLSNTGGRMRPPNATAQDFGWGLQEATSRISSWVRTPQYQPMRYGEMWEKPSTYSGQVTVGAPVFWWK